MITLKLLKKKNTETRIFSIFRGSTENTQVTYLLKKNFISIFAFSVESEP